MKTITISSVIDVVGSLANDDISGSVYFMDNNKAGGSIGQGTENLRTVVEQGDRLVWTVICLECEAYSAIDSVDINKEFCEPEKKIYPGTDISYWVGTVKKPIVDVEVPYSIKFKAGTRHEPITTTSNLALVGKKI
ncbi:hypothetical conserved protein [Candidatus Nitrosoglobus terrae]|uniref:Hypothetical conserved protein n=1 Tax=Candidatus Nitrosoglobus terrae TaxID=1630141 RepID=A0A1Q2SKM3_9GAMM|nr:hypothetical protein [Candidatus Nitrosoglobus terrae]BAW79669.1 hypothetical conserved protein [Candidatus Nitrosoglobus terrae]